MIRLCLDWNFCFDDTYMLAETLLIEVTLALNVALVVRPLSRLVNLKWSFTGAWGVSADKSSCILLELSSLGLNFEFIVAVESGGILFEHSTFSVDSGSSLRLGLSLDFKSCLSFILTVERLFVGHKDRSSWANLSLVTIELSLVTLVTFTIHVCWHNAVLDSLELVSDSVSRIKFSLVASVEEFTRSCIVLRCSIRNFILEELFLSQFECRVILDIFVNLSERVLGATLLSWGLVKLIVAELANLGIILSTIEGCIRLHHSFLLVLGQVWKTTCNVILSLSDSHLLSTGLS